LLLTILEENHAIPGQNAEEKEVLTTGMSPTITLQYDTVRKNVPFRTYLVKVGEEEPELAGLEAWSQGINATSSPVPKIKKKW